MKAILPIRKLTLPKLLFLMSVYLCNPALAHDTLILAIHPYLPHDDLVKKFTPIAQYLGKKIGKKIDVRIGSNYEEHIHYIGTDKVDIAYMGPASYISLVTQYGEKPILARLEINKQPYFQGNIIVRKDAGIKSLADLTGKRIAFGDPNSTMSYIVPHYMLHEAGVFTDQKTKHQFLHSHNNVALGVLSGDYDAGAVKPAVFLKFADKGLQTIAKTPKISEHLFVTRANLPTAQVAALRAAMLGMSGNADGLNALHAIKKSVTALVAAEKGHYDNLRMIIQQSKNLH